RGAEVEEALRRDGLARVGLVGGALLAPEVAVATAVAVAAPPPTTAPVAGLGVGLRAATVVAVLAVAVLLLVAAGLVATAPLLLLGPGPRLCRRLGRGRLALGPLLPRRRLRRGRSHVGRR